MTKNFTVNEVIHRTQDFPSALMPIATEALQFVQSVRDELCRYFGKDVPLKIMSGYRSPAYNKILKGAAPNSYHQWRYDKQGNMIFALDVLPIGVPLKAAFQVIAEFVQGETYIHHELGFIHMAPYGPDEVFSK